MMLKDLAKISTFVLSGLFASSAAAEDCPPDSINTYHAAYAGMADTVDYLVSTPVMAWDEAKFSGFDKYQVQVLAEAFSNRHVVLKDDVEELLEDLSKDVRYERPIDWKNATTTAPQPVEYLLQNLGASAPTQAQVIDVQPLAEAALEGFRIQGLAKLKDVMARAPDPVCSLPYAGLDLL
jgi:hypothetical protein